MLPMDATPGDEGQTALPPKPTPQWRDSAVAIAMFMMVTGGVVLMARRQTIVLETDTRPIPAALSKMFGRASTPTSIVANMHTEVQALAAMLKSGKTMPLDALKGLRSELHRLDGQIATEMIQKLDPVQNVAASCTTSCKTTCKMTANTTKQTIPIGGTGKILPTATAVVNNPPR